MADAVFFDVLPRFDWAAQEAGTRKMVGIFDSAAKQIARTFGAEAGNAAKGAVDKINADMRAMQESVATATTAATNDYRKMVLAQGDLEASTLRVVEAVEKSGAESSKYAAALAKQEAATIKAAQANDAYVASTVREADANRALAAATAEHSAAVTAATSKTAAFGTAAGIAGKVGLAAFAGAVYETGKAAGDFEQSQTRLVSSAGESASNLKVVSDGILKLAGDVGYSAGELSKGMYTVESANYRGAEGIKVMTAAAQGAKAENADLTAVNQGLTTSLNDFFGPGKGADQAGTVMSKMVTAVGLSKTTFQGFSESLHSVEPAAAAAHIKLDDVYGVLARMTQSGMSADQATQNMRNAINSLAAPTAQQATAMAQLGINADDVSQKLGERGLAGTMQYLSETVKQHLDPAGNVTLSALNENAQAAQNAADMMTQMTPAARDVAQAFANGTMSRKEFTAAIKGSNATDAAQLQQFGALELKLDGFSKQFKGGRELTETYMNALKQLTGTVAGQSVALQTTGENADATNKAIADIAKTTTDADGKVKGFAETQQTYNAKLADAKAAFGAAAIEVGNDFLPALKNMATWLGNTAKFLGEHKPLLDGIVISLGAMGGGWLVVKAAMAFQSVWAAMEKGLAFMILKFGEAKAAVALTATELQGLGPAAAAGAAGVETATAAEVVAVDRVTAAAGAAKLALGAAATAAIALIGYMTAVPAADDFISKHAPKPVADTLDKGNQLVPKDHPLAFWDWPLWGAVGNQVGDAFHGDFHKLQLPPKPAPATPAPDASANADEVNRRLAASGVGPLVPKLPISPAGVDAANDAADNARPDITAPGSVAPGGGSGSSSKSTATGPNIAANAPYRPIDLNPADMPAGADYDKWVDAQKSMQAAQQKVDDTATDLAKAQARQTELTRKGTATQEEWNSAAESLAKAQRENQQAIQDATIAEHKATTSIYNKSKKTDESSSGMGPTGTSILTSPMEFTPAGIAKYFTALITNLAVGNPVGKALAEKGSASNPLYVLDASKSMFGAGGPGGPGGPRQPYGMPPGGGGQFPDWVNQVSSYFGIKPSTYGGHQETDRNEAGYAPNPQHLNRGIDWSGPTENLQRFVDYLKSIPQDLEQVIYQNPATGERTGIAGGRDVTNTGYYASDYGEHGDHVHTRQSASIPLPGAADTGAYGSGSSAGYTMPQWTADWNGVAQGESGGNWGINTGNGFYGGLQFTQSSWEAAGGTAFAQRADLATPYQQAMVAEKLKSMQGPGAWPHTFKPGSSGPAPDGGAGDGGDGGGGPLPTGNILEQLQSEFLGGGGEGPVLKRSPAAAPPAVGIGSAAGANLGGPFAPGGALSATPGPAGDQFGNIGQPWRPAPQQPGQFGPNIADFAPGHNGPHGGVGDRIRAGGAGPSAVPDRPSSVGNSQQFGAGQAAGAGFSSSIGSTVGGLAAAAFPGIGQGAQVGGKLMDRTIGYLGQLGGIAAEAPLETFLPGGFGDKLADPSKSWLGKLAIGIIGAHPGGSGGDNRAGQSVPTDPAKEAAKQASAAAPAAPAPDQPHQGTGAPPGPGGGGNGPLVGEMTINTTQGVDGGAVARDMNRYVGGASR